MVITFNAPRSRRNEILAPHHLDTWSTAAGDDPGPSGNNPMTHANHSSDGSSLSPHQPESADAAPSSSSSSSLLQIRFQFSSGVYFNVCRQLWWHYVNTAGKISIFYIFFLLQKFHSHNARALHCWIIQIPNWRIYCLLSSLVSILDIVQLLYISSRTSHNCQNWQQRMKPCVTAEEIASPSSFYPLSSNYYHFFILLLLFLCVTTHI